MHAKRVLAGGSTGPAVVPGNPRESLLVDAINYGETYHMPPKSKLPPEEIATLTEWVQRGAPWGIGHASSGRIIRVRQDSGRSLEGRIRGAGALLELSAAFASDAPAVKPSHAGWVRNPIDRFILAALEAKNLDARARGRQAHLDPPPLF